LQISSSMQNCRCFSLTASASSSASKVASVIAVEIEHEQEHYEQPGVNRISEFYVRLNLNAFFLTSLLLCVSGAVECGVRGIWECTRSCEFGGHSADAVPLMEK
jgi:hypothetical protein